MRSLLIAVLLFHSVAAQSPFDQVEDLTIIRALYPTEPLITGSAEEGRRGFQVGENAAGNVTVLSRAVGRFTDPEKPSMVALVAVESTSGRPSGHYAVIFTLDEHGKPKPGVWSEALSRRIPPTGNRYWRVAATTDIDFDKLEDLILMEGNLNTGVESYHIYHWNGQGFAPITRHPALELLKLLSNLDLAARRAAIQQSPDAKIQAAYDTYSPKLQMLQAPDDLRLRIQQARGVQLDALKVMIQSAASALVRAEYSYLEADGGRRRFQGDYQIRLYGEDWKIDSERVKALTQ